MSFVDFGLGVSVRMCSVFVAFNDGSCSTKLLIAFRWNPPLICFTSHRHQPGVVLAIVKYEEGVQKVPKLMKRLYAIWTLVKLQY